MRHMWLQWYRTDKSRMGNLVFGDKLAADKLFGDKLAADKLAAVEQHTQEEQHIQVHQQERHLELHQHLQPTSPEHRGSRRVREHCQLG